jgi:hypothetical protein
VTQKSLPEKGKAFLFLQNTTGSGLHHHNHTSFAKEQSAHSADASFIAVYGN